MAVPHIADPPRAHSQTRCKLCFRQRFLPYVQLSHWHLLHPHVLRPFLIDRVGALLKTKQLGLGNGSVVTVALRGPEFKSQHSAWAAHIYLEFQVPGM